MAPGRTYEVGDWVGYRDCGVWRVGRVTAPNERFPRLTAVLMIHTDQPEPRLAQWVLNPMDLTPHEPTPEEEQTWLEIVIAS